MTAIAIIAETNGFALITSARQLTSYAGLDIIARQSGTEDPKHHISKKGNIHIRKALYFPAMVSTRFNPQVKDLYGRICQRNPKVKMIGITAAMRKMLILVYTLWKSDQIYDPERMSTSTPRKKPIEIDHTQEDTSTPVPLTEPEIAMSKMTDEELLANGIAPPF